MSFCFSWSLNSKIPSFHCFWGSWPPKLNRLEDICNDHGTSEGNDNRKLTTQSIKSSSLNKIQKPVGPSFLLKQSQLSYVNCMITIWSLLNLKTIIYLRYSYPVTISYYVSPVSVKLLVASLLTKVFDPTAIAPPGSRCPSPLGNVRGLGRHNSWWEPAMETHLQQCFI